MVKTDIRELLYTQQLVSPCLHLASASAQLSPASVTEVLVCQNDIDESLPLSCLTPSVTITIIIIIKNCSSLYSFKRHLKSHLIAQLINHFKHTPSGHLVTYPRLWDETLSGAWNYIGAKNFNGSRNGIPCCRRAVAKGAPTKICRHIWYLK